MSVFPKRPCYQHIGQAADAPRSHELKSEDETVCNGSPESGHVSCTSPLKGGSRTDMALICRGQSVSYLVDVTMDALHRTIQYDRHGWSRCSELEAVGAKGDLTCRFR
jgi:hypothetical protein